ncbi:NAD(P)/FAD-dependent oxidoreductase [Actibacterium ureilyticum]|uniref:NAD(P)/FAD-dependent oxidoreductase n=1 Tax=Actibacterium ureilyticum TaxID=1590614 RepID=UPI000BAB093F|nr:NAD(P)/FAD-dependent oxidoreductase [Actibacterium ureilyticum]
MQDYDTIILGAGAAGLMCAAHTGGRTLLVDHAETPGEKIRISGGGRCNFTNLHAGPGNFLSANPHFAKSALARYTQWDFIDLVSRHGIAWHEKTLGQLFCDHSAKDIIAMLLAELRAAGAELRCGTEVGAISHDGTGFRVTLTPGGMVRARNLVVATGGKSIPKMGATGLGYDIARQFGHAITDTRPALVPLTFGDRFKALSGVALPARVNAGGASFDEAVLFTHRGLSGPAILQISSFWREGDAITLNLLPEADAFDTLRGLRAEAGARNISTMLATCLPGKLATYLCELHGWRGNMADLSDAALRPMADALQAWELRPTGSEGYRTAEVTLGGVDTDGLNARTMESKHQPGLYFVGEVVDVTGWLGGYNFQWAWSSGWAAGTAIAQAGEAPDPR